MQQASEVGSLRRGLQLLQFVNEHDGLGAAALARLAGINRSTAYRLLETLAADGFVRKSAADQSYRPTVKTRTLSAGAGQGDWIERVAAGPVAALGRELRWPVALSTFDGALIRVRYATDHDTTLIARRFTAGTRMSLVGTSAGRLFLAYSDPALRRAIIRQSLSVEGEAVDGHDDEPLDFAALLDRIRVDGYAVHYRAEVRVSTLSVPLLDVALDEERFLAALTIRVFSAAMPPRDLAPRYLGALQATAAQLMRDYR